MTHTIYFRSTLVASSLSVPPSAAPLLLFLSFRLVPPLSSRLRPSSVQWQCHYVRGGKGGQVLFSLTFLPEASSFPLVAIHLQNHTGSESSMIEHSAIMFSDGRMESTRFIVREEWNGNEESYGEFSTLEISRQKIPADVAFPSPFPSSLFSPPVTSSAVQPRQHRAVTAQQTVRRSSVFRRGACSVFSSVHAPCVSTVLCCASPALQCGEGLPTDVCKHRVYTLVH
jgi:hypothetical protein